MKALKLKDVLSFVCSVVLLIFPFFAFAAEGVEGAVTQKLSETSATWILSRSIGVAFEDAKKVISMTTKGWAVGQEGPKYAVAAGLAINVYHKCLGDKRSQNECIGGLETTIQAGKLLEPDAREVFDDLHEFLDWTKICGPLATDEAFLGSGEDWDTYQARKKKIWSELQCEQRGIEMPGTMTRITGWIISAIRVWYLALLGTLLAVAIGWTIRRIFDR